MQLILRILAWPLILLNMIPSLVLHWVAPKSIDVIYVVHFQGHVFHESFGVREYKIDLVNGTLWTWAYTRENPGDPFVWRDPEAENEGFEFARYLDEDAIRAFRRRAVLYGFNRWGESYPPRISIGHTWRVEIVFSDGTTRLSRGAHNAERMPLTWGRMGAAFEALTGEEILALWSR